MTLSILDEIRSNIFFGSSMLFRRTGQFYLVIGLNAPLFVDTVSECVF